MEAFRESISLIFRIIIENPREFGGHRFHRIRQRRHSSLEIEEERGVLIRNHSEQFRRSFPRETGSPIGIEGIDFAFAVSDANLFRKRDGEKKRFSGYIYFDLSVVFFVSSHCIGRREAGSDIGGIFLYGIDCRFHFADKSSDKYSCVGKRLRSRGEMMGEGEIFRIK